MTRIEGALRRLIVAARTSGGVAGRDEGLCAACDEAEAALAAGPIGDSMLEALVLDRDAHKRRADRAEEFSLKKMLQAAVETYEAMTPDNRRRHDYEQKRSFVRGMCPSHRDYEEWCKTVDRYLPPLGE